MNKFEAIIALRPNAKFSIEGDTVMNWTESDGKDVPTDGEINNKITELQAEYDVQEYARNRKAEYPPIADQQDMQFHDAIDGTTTWQDAIQAVKNKYPKPE
jgi:hypothetical protein